jgi:hypothetical protein
VTRGRWGVVTLLILLSAAIVAVAAAVPASHRAVALSGVLLFADATGLLLLGRTAVAASGPAPPSAFESALRRPSPRPHEPEQLAEIGRSLELGVASAFDFHTRLRPLLREIAASRLAAAHGVDIDSDAGRRLLGDDAWRLLSRDREPPDDRRAPGPSFRDVERLVAAIEAV